MCLSLSGFPENAEDEYIIKYFIYILNVVFLKLLG